MSSILAYLSETSVVVAAAVAAGTSLIVALLNHLVSPFSQRFVERAKAELLRDIEAHKVDLQHRIEDHKSQLSKNLSENNARLAYEFDARKRLYAQVEPLIFQLFEASEQSYYRVASLVRTSRAGQLNGKNSWLIQEGYYLYSTIYWLFLPLAIFRNLQRTATFFDLRLDDSIRFRYFLLKWSYLCFTDDHELSRLEPVCSYRPNLPNWRQLREQDAAAHWRQGLVLGNMDRLTDAMVVGEGTARRVLTFGEFEARIRSDPDFRTLFGPAIDILIGFDFAARPVLARILLAQAVLHRLILYTYTVTPTIEGLYAAAERFVRSTEFSADIAWWREEEGNQSSIVLTYVQERLHWISSDDYAIPE